MNVKRIAACLLVALNVAMTGCGSSGGAGSQNSNANVSQPAEDQPAGSWKSVPSGTTESLYGMWGSSASDIWAVGSHGTIQHWDGISWKSVPSGSNLTLRGIWGSSPNDIWVVGGASDSADFSPVNGFSGILHWNGTSWSSVTTGTLKYLNSIWGNSANDVWATGEGVIVHWNGNSWTSVRTDVNYVTWTGSTNDVWTFWNATAKHWDGNSWSAQNLPVSAASQVRGDTHLNKIWASSPNDIWVVGSFGNTIHWDGASWTSVMNSLPGIENYLEGVWGSSSNDVWVSGYTADFLHIEKPSVPIMLHWNGTSWSQVATPTGSARMLAGWGYSPNDVWACGLAGMVWRYQ